MRRRRVGLIITTDIPGIGLVAILRERGIFNLNDLQPETWPGVCQATVHGRLEPGEDPPKAILRELEEELGPDFAFHVAALIAVDHNIIKKVAFAEISEDKVVTTFTIKIDCNLLKRIRLSPESGAIRIVSLSEVSKIVEATVADRIICLENRETIKMHPDEKNAITKAFELASS